MKLTHLACYLHYYALILCTTIVSQTNSVVAQTNDIVPDNTLGAESSVVNPRDANSESIDGGAVRGQNLFHSFQEFNVDAGTGVYFANPEAVTNIFSRVTGGNPSNILGTLGVDGAANLFLINPNGIVFGQGASLDVQGSFTATTADGIEFGEQGFFSAVNPQSPKLLTINPSAYLFNQVAPGAIANNSQASADFNPSPSFDDTFFGLRVPNGQNLLLLGGDVNVDGGGLFASGGRIDLGAIAEQGIVGINENGSLNIPDSIARGDVSLTNGAAFSVAGDGGGDMAIATKNINILAGSFLNAGILSNLGLPDAQAGDITINATDNITVDSSGVANEVYSEAVGNAGDIFIDANSLQVLNGGLIGAFTSGQGDGGNVTVCASDIELAGISSDRQLSSSLFTEIGFQAQGDGGKLTIDTDNLSLSDRAQISASTYGQGDAGTINITSGSLNLTNTSFIDTSTFGQGNAGEIDIQVPITLDKLSGINSSVDTAAVGDAGTIDLTTGSLSATNGSQINSFTSGQGNAGDITIQASDAVTFDGFDSNNNYNSSAFSNVDSGAVGNGGNIKIAARSLSLTNGGQLEASVFGETDTLSGGKGQGGSINIDVDDTLTIAGENTQGIFASLYTGAVGNAGKIDIQARNLVVQDGGQINSFTSGRGNAGDITIQATDTVTFDGFDSDEFPSSLNTTVEVGAVGDGGNISLTAGDIRLRDGSDIRTNVYNGTGDGGNINITADSVIAFDDSDIFASAPEGQGGNITLDTPAYFGENFTLNSLTANPDTLNNNSRADINATGAFSGSVSIPNVSFIQNSLTELPNNSINTDELVANSCVVPVGERSQGKFIITGTESLPVRPGDGLPSKYPTGEVRNVPEKQSGWQPGDPIIEPQGAYRLANGKLVLSRQCSQ